MCKPIILSLALCKIPKMGVVNTSALTYEIENARTVKCLVCVFVRTEFICAF